MNCENCGAAMRIARSGGYFTCDYCATIAFPPSESPEVDADGVIVTGDQVELSCPICAEWLAVGVVDGLEVRHCRTCRGVLATNKDFADIVKRRRLQRDPEKEQVLTPIRPQELQRVVDCPQCHQRMETHPYYGPGNVVVDTCVRCFLIWLDHGEIGVIQNAPGRR